LLQVLPLIVY